MASEQAALPRRQTGAVRFANRRIGVFGGKVIASYSMPEPLFLAYGLYPLLASLAMRGLVKEGDENDKEVWL